MIDGLPLNFLRILSAESLFPEFTDSARKFILDQILNSEVLDIFPDDKAQLKLGEKTIVAKFSQPLPTHKFVVGQNLNGEVLRTYPDGKAQIKLEGHTFVADVNNALTPGQKVTAKVEQLSPTPVIRFLGVAESPKSDRTTINKSAVNQAVNRAEALTDFESLNLSIGQEVEGSVSAVIDDGTALVQINGKQLKALNPNRFSAGDAVIVKVEKVAGQINLVVASQISESQAQADSLLLKSYLPSKQPFGEVLGNLERTLVGNPLLSDLKIDPKLLENLKGTLKLLYSDNPTPSANTIKSQIDQSGVGYEAKVREVLTGKPASEIARNKIDLARDLKGQLIKLAKELESLQFDSSKNSTAPSIRENPKVVEVLQSIKQAIDNIELNQLSNHYAKQENQPVLLQIPYPATEDKAINLYVKKQPGGDKKNPGDKQGFNLVFLLDMTALGSLRVDAQVNNDQLNVKIGSENQGVVDFIQANAVGLKERLGEIGFSAEVSCGRQKKDEMQVEESLSRLFIQDPSRLIDVKT